MSNGLSFRHSGDLGDAIYALSVMSEIHGSHTLRCVNRPGITGEFLKRVPLLIDLLESQNYIKKVECSEEHVECDFVPFRRHHGSTTTLVRAQAVEIGWVGGTGADPWLKVKPSKVARGRIIIARSPRYNNIEFPWKEIVAHYGERLLFVGLQEEYDKFCAFFGRVEQRKVKNFLELAELIAGSELFIGNQSSPMAIAMGLGHNVIQEVCIEQPDCIYKRDNVVYYANGEMTLPDVGGSGTHFVKERRDDHSKISRAIVPSGGWKYRGLPDCDHFQVQKRLVMKVENCDDSTADEKLLEYNYDRVMKFYHGTAGSKLLPFETAYNNAFSGHLV